jgi:hypothetical protein
MFDVVSVKVANRQVDFTQAFFSEDRVMLVNGMVNTYSKT